MNGFWNWFDGWMGGVEESEKIFDFLLSPALFFAVLMLGMFAFFCIGIAMRTKE